METWGNHLLIHFIIASLAVCCMSVQKCWKKIIDITHSPTTTKPTHLNRCILLYTVYLKKYAHGVCFAVLCCGYTWTDFPISIRLTSLALWQSNDCPSASKATLMNMNKYFMWIHYERLHNHNKAKHNKTVCIFLGIYCKLTWWSLMPQGRKYCIVIIS